MNKKIYIYFLSILLFFFLFPYESVLAVDYSNIKYGIVNFKTKSCNINTSYNEAATGRAGYTNGCYGADGAFLGMENGKVKFMLAGVVGTVNSEEVTVVDLPKYDATTYISSYIVRKDILYHCPSIDIGYASGCYPVDINRIGLKRDQFYLSYDGHYFYDYTVDNFKRMIDDYKNGNRNHAYNKTPYYNYYQFVTHRTKTNQTVNDLNNYINLVAPNGKMANLGSAFIENQNIYGVNGALAFGIAGNESAWGTSNYALNRNNLFGHKAYDGNPDKAGYYNSPSENVKMHDKVFISEGYMDPCDWTNRQGQGYALGMCLRGRYNGGHVGNKASGIAVKYASDPYWSEKAASNYFKLENSTGITDNNYYTIGIKNKFGNLNVYKEPNVYSTLLYQSSPSNDYSVIILEKVIGNDNKTWYKIQSDPTLDGYRNKLVQDHGEYNFDNNYGYIKEEDVNVYAKGKKPIKDETNIFYDITFDANGGVFSDNALKKIIKTKNNEMPNVPSPVREGYTFSKWNPNILLATSNTTYKAEWKINQYNVTFDANGGKFTNGEVKKVLKLDYGTLPEIDIPIKENYVFKGWDKEISNVKGDIIYKAKWEKGIMYNITFDANGGLFSNNKDKLIVEVGKNKLPDFEIPFKSGYVFDKWNPVIKNATEDTIYKAEWKKGTVEDLLVKKDGEFYLDYLKVKDNHLKIKGYHIIKGINNDLTTNINYEFILRNQDTGKEYSQKLNRIINEKDMPMPILSDDGYNYKYAWFEGNIEFDEIDQGDYTAFFRSSTDKYYARDYVQNILLSEQVTEYSDKDKNITIINDYVDINIPMEFIVRKNRIGKKETSFGANQYSLFEDISFKNNLLHILAASYSVDLDMRSNNKMLSRELIFENIKTFDQKRIEVGSLDTPIYPLYLVRADKFGKSKERAWFEKTIDISDLDKGIYAIYVSTKSNISDYGELNDLLFQPLDTSKKKINNKTFEFRKNIEKRNRIELIVS